MSEREKLSIELARHIVETQLYTFIGVVQLEHTSENIKKQPYYKAIMVLLYSCYHLSLLGMMVTEEVADLLYAHQKELNLLFVQPNIVNLRDYGR